VHSHHSPPDSFSLRTRSPDATHADDGGSGRGGDDDGGQWQPGGNEDGVNPVGLAILGVIGLWAYWEWKRPGGKLNSRTRYA